MAAWSSDSLLVGSGQYIVSLSASYDKAERAGERSIYHQ